MNPQRQPSLVLRLFGLVWASSRYWAVASRDKSQAVTKSISTRNHMAYLTLTNVSKQFADSYAVQDFNLDVEKGEFVSFLGPSGCGKTTTLRMIAGFEIPTGGTITLNNKDITTNPPNQRHVGMVFQAYALFPNMTVTQNIGFGLRVRGEKEAAIKERVQEMISLIN